MGLHSPEETENHERKKDFVRTGLVIALMIAVGLIGYGVAQQADQQQQDATNAQQQTLSLAKQITSICENPTTAGDFGGLCSKADTIVREGPQGPDGPLGPQGVQGLEGPIGPQGQQGLPGPQGDMGLMGINGNPGSEGTPGASGINGIDGAQGTQGAQGIQGVPGEKGATGDKGEKGDAGRGISSITCSGVGTSFTVTYSDGTTETVTCDPAPDPSPSAENSQRSGGLSSLLPIG